MISNGPAGVRRRQNCIREYYGQEEPWLLGAAYRIACQRDIADDVIQDAFIQVWHEAHSFDLPTAGRWGWIYSVVAIAP
jgi:RNA polymerase sigma-70 factor (ECF subfamily)